jgi:SET domain-containing protein
LLLIRTKVLPSTIHGVGCFTCEAIKAGTAVWQLHPVVDVAFSAAQILAMPPAFQIFLAQYASKDRGQDRYVLCTDNARFINHAVPPNLRHSSNTSAENIFANRDIVSGEELTLDYQFVDDPDEAGNVLTEIGMANGDTDELDPRIKPPSCVP